MIGFVKGQIEDISEGNVVIDTGGIGYNVKISAGTMAQLPGLGEEVKLYTYTCVREDMFSLYGFLSRDDLEIYKKLIAVNGIGPKGALSILSVMSTDDLRCAIVSGDSKSISKAPGIGNKSAERIILELRDKVRLGFEASSAGTSAAGGSLSNTAAKNEATEALISLGYLPAEALKAVNQIKITDDMDSGSILKQALRVIMR